MPASDYRPTVQQVASKLPARTHTRGGVEAGVFNTDTRPTADQAEAVIDQALIDVAGEIGTEIPAAVDDDVDPVDVAQSLATLYAAAMIEMGFWSEQVATGESIYAQLMELYEKRLPGVKRLMDRLRAAEGDTGDDMGERAALPVSHFPVNAGGLVGYRTRF